MFRFFISFFNELRKAYLSSPYFFMSDGKTRATHGGGLATLDMRLGINTRRDNLFTSSSLGRHNRLLYRAQSFWFPVKLDSLIHARCRSSYDDSWVTCRAGISFGYLDSSLVSGSSKLERGTSRVDPVTSISTLVLNSRVLRLGPFTIGRGSLEQLEKRLCLSIKAFIGLLSSGARAWVEWFGLSFPTPKVQELESLSLPFGNLPLKISSTSLTGLSREIKCSSPLKSVWHTSQKSKKASLLHAAAGASASYQLKGSITRFLQMPLLYRKCKCFPLHRSNTLSVLPSSHWLAEIRIVRGDLVWLSMPRADDLSQHVLSVVVVLIQLLFNSIFSTFPVSSLELVPGNGAGSIRNKSLHSRVEVRLLIQNSAADSFKECQMMSSELKATSSMILLSTSGKSYIIGTQIHTWC